jgi:outer membrane lipoprotein-sorting protein
VGLTLAGLTPVAPAGTAHAAPQAAAAAEDLFDEIYRRGQPFEQSLKTVRARFTETTTSSLLVRPLVAEGTLVVVRPSDILLTYTKPERRLLRLDATTLLFVWPDRQLRERKDIREAQARVQKYFVSKTPAELRKHFTIRTTEDRARAGTWRIEMVPTRKQIQQGLARLELWVRQDTLMLAAMTMTFPNGDTKSMTFRDVVVNEPVSPDELTLSP